MNESLQKALGDILNLLTEGAKAIGTTAQTELPLLVQEYLRWAFWSNAFTAFLCLIPILGILAGWRKFLKSDSRHDEDYYFPVFFLGGIAMLFTLGFFFDSAYTAAKVSIAPRVYLLEELKDFVKE